MLVLDVFRADILNKAPCTSSKNFHRSFETSAVSVVAGEA